ncbi:MAG TPA: hypothetical protein VMT30_06370 [Candidatus Saccharimonadia bacterium]|nr:hypothetical protein [Candidatus Saccharimonadia bacterium]
MYQPGIVYERTPEEYRDPFLAWKREDRAFFAAGACHILAHMFLELHTGEGYKLIHIKPRGEQPGHHMYASNGVWVFDFNGWTREEELLEVYGAAYRQKHPGWEYERIVVEEGLPSYALKNNHRPPEYFPYLPWERAYTYIKRFPAEPPSE